MDPGHCGVSAASDPEVRQRLQQQRALPVLELGEHDGVPGLDR